MRTSIPKQNQPQDQTTPNLARSGTKEPATSPKLEINTPGDVYERQAERIAEQVMHGDARLQPQHAGSGGLGQTAAPPIVHEVLRSPGQPLDAATRAFMEPRFEHDFSRVRVHTDRRAAESAQSVNASAYTVGRHIVFGEGQHSPSSATGQQLLAHELAHVTQQEEPNRAPAAPRLQRQPAARDPRPLDRPGAQWPFGPITKHKVAQYNLSTYVAWVKEVEKAIGPDKQAVLQRLRRLYYSKYSGAAGAEFDRVIADQAGASSGDPPLDTRIISAAALDGLYETNVVRLRDGALIDVSHVLAGLDLKTSGLTFKAGAAEAVYNVSWLGVVTWAGDLASWYIKWITQFLAGTLPTPTAADALHAAQKVDLLSDMDAQILAAENVCPSKIEHVKAERRPIIDKNVGTELSMPVSAILERYDAAQPAKSQGRFAAFVRIATPPIPHQSANADGSGAVTLAADAQDAIYDTVRRTARLMILEGKSLPFGEEALDHHESQLRHVAQQFTRFLRKGLQTGDAPWPYAQ